MLNTILKKVSSVLSIWTIALPLAVLGFGLVFARGIAEFVMHDDPIFLLIDLCGMALLVFGLWPWRHRILRSIRGSS